MPPVAAGCRPCGAGARRGRAKKAAGPQEGGRAARMRRGAAFEKGGWRRGEGVGDIWLPGAFRIQPEARHPPGVRGAAGSRPWPGLMYFAGLLRENAARRGRRRKHPPQDSRALLPETVSRPLGRIGLAEFCGAQNRPACAPAGRALRALRAGREPAGPGSLVLSSRVV
jgi:hypothetical protein